MNFVILLLVLAIANFSVAFNLPVFNAITRKSKTNQYYLLFDSAFLHNFFVFLPQIAMQLDMSVKLVYKDDEPIENALKRFKRSVNQSGHLNVISLF
jgi:hypothetical protein